MGKHKKLAILSVLIVVAMIIWMPKGEKRRQICPVSSLPEASKPQPPQRKRTAFTEWGRNPFVWPKAAAAYFSGLTLSGIMWDEELPYAIINGEIVHPGDSIAGKAIKRIEPDKVILSDGLTEYPLELK